MHWNHSPTQSADVSDLNPYNTSGTFNVHPSPEWLNSSHDSTMTSVRISSQRPTVHDPSPTQRPHSFGSTSFNTFPSVPQRSKSVNNAHYAKLLPRDDKNAHPAVEEHYYTKIKAELAKQITESGVECVGVVVNQQCSSLLSTMQKRPEVKSMSASGSACSRSDKTRLERITWNSSANGTTASGRHRPDIDSRQPIYAKQVQVNPWLNNQGTTPCDDEYSEIDDFVKVVEDKQCPNDSDYDDCA